jgi:hypothetical protein
VDFDADGRLDLLSGSYDPGEIYLFRGLGPNQFAPRETLLDRAGKPILKVPDQRDPVDSFGSWAALVDWDHDADLDLLVGTFNGMLFLRINEGTRQKPAFAAQNIWVTVGEKPMRVPGGEHFSPVIADWDGDGRWDILTGAANGGAYWYRNIGTPAQPRFEPPVTLVPPHEGIGYDEVIMPGAQPRPGIRSQIAVFDHDSDGKLDILLGDFTTNLHLRPDLSAREKRAFQQLQEESQASTRFLRDALENLRARYKKEMDEAGVPLADWSLPQHQKRFQQLHQAMRNDSEYQKHATLYQENQKAMKRFVVPRPGHPDDPAHPQGYVWLFRRR